ncbi:MAG: cation diffusion facilitator family transporter [Anaerolineales bacterium]|nr:cation diffusion facilitator family transporter [Anaerolineales bacterium]
MKTATRVAWASIALNICLSLLNLVIAAASGSLAVAAEMIHNLVDLLASVAVLVGINLSERKSRTFPYGLYKVENVVAVGVAILIFFTGYEIAREAIFAEATPATVNGWMLAGVVLSAAAPFAFSRYEMRVGRQLNSPSLMADAQEFRVHVFSSGVVLLALLGQLVGFPVDRYAALVIVVLIARTGYELLADGMRVLLDASLDPETLAQVRSILEAEPAVAEVRSVVGRNAGRYRFLEADVVLRVDGLEKAHSLSHRLAETIRQQVPHVERVQLHVEPQVRTHVRYSVPLVDPHGTISQHFGESPYFALVTLRLADNKIEDQQVRANPHHDVVKAKGIRVAEWLVSLKIDEVILREKVQGKGPAYVFADAGVNVRLTQATTLAEAIAGETTTAGAT